MHRHRGLKTTPLLYNRSSLPPFPPLSLYSNIFSLVSKAMAQFSCSVSGSCVASILCLLLVQTHRASSFLLATLKNHRSSHHHNSRPMIHGNQTSCSLSVGTWVRDDSYPIYQSSACPIIEPEFNCQMHGRPDSDYQKYCWRPSNCELPRFNGLDFLMKMRGKTVMFVGDSLGRNQWESLICMISSEVSRSQTQTTREVPLSTFKFLDYGVTVSYYRAPYLVDVDVMQGKRVLRLDDISENGNTWRAADVLLFNTGHWWSHKGSLQGWDYIEWGGSMYQEMDEMVALERGLRTWARWVDTNVDTSRTRVFFQSIAPTHSNCYGEKVPMTGTADLGPYSDQLKVVEEVINQMNSPAYLLDITTLSQMRKDAHPSVYGGPSADQGANLDHSADCAHWCLPGLPDTWNQLLYTVLFF